MGEHGRRERVHPDAAATASTTDVRRVRIPTCTQLGRTFVSPASLDAGLAERWESDRPLVATDDVSRLSKSDLPENTALPRIDVDPETFTVHVDGELITVDPAQELPMTQRYFLF